MITGFFNHDILPQPLLRVAVQIPDVRPDWIPIPFVVDTGAALTCIHALDAMAKFGMSPASLDPAMWRASMAVGGVGGQLQYLERPARFGFMHDDGAVEVIEASIRIGAAASQALPSLLGCDILSRFEVVYRGGRSITLTSLT